MRRIAVVLAAASALAGSAVAAPLTDEATTFIERTLFKAKLMSNPTTALAFCRQAEGRAAGYDREPFYDGAIARCLALSEMHMKNGQAACAHFARALEALSTVRADHPKRAEASKWLGQIREDRATLRC